MMMTNGRLLSLTEEPIHYDLPALMTRAPAIRDTDDPYPWLGMSEPPARELGWQRIKQRVRSRVSLACTRPDTVQTVSQCIQG